MSNDIRLAEPLRTSGTCSSRAILACTMTGHTPPGTYLPSCPISTMRAADRQPSTDPIPASTDRQIGTAVAAPTMPSTSAPATGQNCTDAQASASSARWA